jgi:DNA-binding SARP family transcriptional activator/tetratricopeptide (TPR) repeat protein
MTGARHVADWRSRIDADRISILGPVRMVAAGQTHRLPGIAARLVTLLCCTTGRWVTLDEMIDSIWGATPPQSARSALHVHLGSIRRWLKHGEPDGPELAKSATGYRLNPGMFEVDYQLLLDLVQHGHRLIADSPDEAVDALRAALALHTCPLDVSPDSGAELVATAQRIESARLTGEEDLVDALLETGAVTAAELEAVCLVEQSPYRERRWAQLMRARFLDNRTHEALRTFAAARQLFVDELGIEPGSLLQGLERSILTHDVAGAARREGIVQAAATVPAPTGPMFGRGRDVQRCLEGLAEGKVVVVHGPPGVGKTRLAQEVCELAGSDRFAIWVDLREHDDPVRALALALGAPPASPLDDLTAMLGGTAALVVFDNAEHLRELVDDAVRELRRGGTTPIQVLVTSRITPALPATLLELRPLPLPAPGGPGDTFDANPAVQLLRHAIGDLAPNVTLQRDEIEQICEGSAGLPLALRLSANILRSVGATDRVPLVHNAVGAQYAPLVDATMSLLTSSRQDAYMSLSVMAGPFDVRLGAAVTGLPVEAFVATIADLVDAGLVDVDPGPPARYQILPQLRDVVVRSTAGDDRSRAALDRLCDHAIAEAKALAERLRRGDTTESVEPQAAAATTIATTAMAYLVEIADAERALELAARLDPPLYSLGWWTEKNELLDCALALSHKPTFWRARALAMRGRAGLLSKFDLDALNDAETIAASLGEDNLRAYASHLRSVGLWWQGDYQAALEAAQFAVERFRAGGRQLEELEARKFVGLALFSSGEVDGGLREQHEALAGLERLGITFGVAHSFAYLGHCHRHIGDDTAAAVDLRAALEICDRIGNRGTAIHVQLALGDIAADRGDRPTAEGHVADALRLIERSLLHTYEPWAWALAMRAANADDDIDRVLGCARHGLDTLKYAAGGDVNRFAYELAVVALRLDDPVCAARLVGAAQRHTGPREMPLPAQTDMIRHRAVGERVAEALGHAAAQHVAAGQRCTVAEAAGALVTGGRHRRS